MAFAIWQLLSQKAALGMVCALLNVNQRVPPLGPAYWPLRLPAACATRYYPRRVFRNGRFWFQTVSNVVRAKLGNRSGSDGAKRARAEENSSHIEENSPHITSGMVLDLFDHPLPIAPPRG
jgi:hypothetical protein